MSYFEMTTIALLQFIIIGKVSSNTERVADILSVALQAKAI